MQFVKVRENKLCFVGRILDILRPDILVRISNCWRHEQFVPPNEEFQGPEGESDVMLRKNTKYATYYAKIFVKINILKHIKNNSNLNSKIVSGGSTV